MAYSNLQGLFSYVKVERIFVRLLKTLSSHLNFLVILSVDHNAVIHAENLSSVERKVIDIPSILQMVSYKVAIFILLVAVLSRTAFSNSGCLNYCDNLADTCLDNCGGHSCARTCSKALTKCYGNCGAEPKRGYYSSLPREPDQTDDKGLYDIFQKRFTRS